MKVLVTFALEQEFAPWRQLRAFAAVRQPGPTRYRVAIGAAEVSVLLTGAGPARARASVRSLLTAAAESPRPFDACIVAGLAGGLRPDRRPGDVLAARAARAGPELVAQGQPCVVLMDAALNRLAAAAGATPVEQFWTQERVAVSAAEKARLGRVADAVDMETFAVAGEARAWDVPAAAVRAISDAAEEDLPYDFHRFFDPAGALSRPRALAEILRRPQRIPALLRLARQSRRAAANLCAFLDRYLPMLAEQGSASGAEEFEEVAAT